MEDRRSPLRGMVYAALFGAATAVGAYIIIPFPIVPITLQTLFVALAASLLGGRLGALSQFIYLLLGIIGLPVFSGGKAGFGVLMGPTGGYLVGFIVGAYVTGRLMEIREKTTIAWTAFSIAAGFVVIYILGVTQLSLVAKMALSKAISVGVIPFLIGDCLKVVLATLVVKKTRGKINVR
ncbi:MAG: biotin transporter BioY [Deltaproteobacteria bacterium]|nr:biotin transporter BioY [Deltaproteobacteria bacterium]MBW2137819.1 biotin transporter BioY [Deltaproteobacteria bacterium]